VTVALKRAGSTSFSFCPLDMHKVYETRRKIQR
jgi:hypothetical protein